MNTILPVHWTPWGHLYLPSMSWQYRLHIIFAGLNLAAPYLNSIMISSISWNCSGLLRSLWLNRPCLPAKWALAAGGHHDVMHDKRDGLGTPRADLMLAATDMAYSLAAIDWRTGHTSRSHRVDHGWTSFTKSGLHDKAWPQVWLRIIQEVETSGNGLEGWKNVLSEVGGTMVMIILVCHGVDTGPQTLSNAAAGAIYVKLSRVVKGLLGERYWSKLNLNFVLHHDDVERSHRKRSAFTGHCERYFPTPFWSWLLDCLRSQTVWWTLPYAADSCLLIHMTAISSQSTNCFPTQNLHHLAQLWVSIFSNLDPVTAAAWTDYHTTHQAYCL